MSRRTRYDWFASRLSRKSRRPSRTAKSQRLQSNRQLHCELLEDRRLLAITVDTSVDEKDGDYSAGDLSLREAIGLANGSAGPDTITFSPLFDTAQTINLELGELEITDELTITGPGQDLLTIDAQQQSRVLNFSAPNGDLNLEGMTVSGGKTFEDNQDLGFGQGWETTYSGGGIRFLSDGTLTLTNSTVSGNSTDGNFASGGGIFTSTGAVRLTDSTVSGNSTTGAVAHGGGVFADSGAVTLTGSTVSNNTTEEASYGGGIFADSGAVTLTGSTISGNSATGAYTIAGGIYTGLGGLSLTQSTVSGNNATGYLARGGGIFTWRGALTVSSSTISGNSATGDDAEGGGIYVYNVPWDPPITIQNSIVAGNTVAAGSTGADFVPDPDGLIDISYSLIGDNAGTGLSEAQTPDANGNLVGSATGAGIIDPLLAPLADYGGTTQTRSLLAGSPAIDAGDPSILFDPAEFDQRGAPFARVVGGRIDIGAFESDTASAVENADFDQDTDVDGEDFLAWQRGFGITNGATRTDGDANDDGAVGRADLTVWGSQFGSSSTTLASVLAPSHEISRDELAESNSALQAEPVNRDLSASFVDAAIAIEWSNRTRTMSAAESFEYPSLHDRIAIPQDTFIRGDVLQSGPSKFESDATEEETDDDDQQAWISDELLEAVYG